MGGRAALITAFDPRTFRGGIETYSLQIADLLKRYSIDCDIVSPPADDGDDRGFHNEYLARLYRMGRNMFGNDGDYDFMISNSFYGLGYFPPRIKTFNIFHLTHKGFAEEIRDVVPSSQYLEWKLLWGELAESASGFGRTKIAVSGSVREELGSHYGFHDALCKSRRAVITNEMGDSARPGCRNVCRALGHTEGMRYPAACDLPNARRALGSRIRHRKRPERSPPSR
jgi:hypothetical protein